MTTIQTLEIVKYPNEMLRQKSEQIMKNDKEVMEQLQFAKNHVMDEKNHAAGLALPQLGILKRGFAATINGKTEIFINPKIIKKSGVDFDTEGCLSIEEEINGMVPRPKEIMVQYIDQNWKSKAATLKGWNARVFCHELDHLNGVLFFDHIK